MTDIIQNVFNEISLERDPRLWHSYRDDETMLERRIQFLSEFPQTLFSKDIDVTKTPARKNDAIGAALLKKSENISSTKERLKLLGQSLSFSSEEQIDSVLRRRREVHLSVGEDKKALADLQMIVNKSREDEREIEEMENRLKVKESEVEGGNNGVSVTENHKHLKLFSRKVNIRQESGRGRFLVAEEDIKPGELIANETSYTAVLDREFVGTNCTECLLPLETVFPCLTCSKATFCSPHCQRVATAGSHRYWCLVQDSLYRSGSGAWLLAFRILSERELTQWRQAADRLLHHHDESLGMRGDQQYDSHDVVTAYNLVTHDTGADRQAPLLMKEALTALYFLRVLQAKSYFGEKRRVRTGGLSEDEMFICKLLHHFMRVVYYNSHEVTQLMRDPTDWSRNRVVKIGVALNPSLALINHSCDPNYARVVRGKNVLAFATRKIKKGEEILDVYSGTFLKSDLSSREEVHARYNFSCSCLACQQGWPTEQSLPRNVNRTFLADKKLSDKQVKNIESAFKKITNQQKRGSSTSKEVLKEVTGVLARAELIQPHYLKAEAEDILHKALWDIYVSC